MNISESIKKAQTSVVENVDSAMGEIAESVLKHVKSNWPVDSGKSLSGWVISRMGEGTWAISNSVPYVSYVHSNLKSGPVKNPSLAERLILDGLESAYEKVIDKAAKQIFDSMDETVTIV